MSAKNQKNLIVVISVAAALLAGTVLLGGFVSSAPAGSDTQAPAKACQAEVNMAGCPMMAQTASCPKMMAAQTESTGCSKTSCKAGGQKPCCGEKGCCETPCPIPCPKQCCAEDGCCGTAEAVGCCVAKTVTR